MLAAGADRFTDPVPHEALVEPGCNGGLCRWGGLLVASLPDDATRRRRLALRWSADQGRTWSAPVLADAGAAMMVLELMPTEVAAAVQADLWAICAEL